jgi:homoserine/homoserine lactone efflux protein
VLLLGVTFMAIAAVGDSLYAVMAGKAGAWLSRSRIRALEIASGCFLMGGGIWMALRGR